MTDDKKLARRKAWREQKRARRARMTEQELEEKRARDYAVRRARETTIEGAEKKRQAARLWRASNPDKVAAARQRDKERRQRIRDEKRKARETDPAYIEAQRAKQAARDVKLKATQDARKQRHEKRQELKAAKAQEKVKEKLSREDMARRKREARVKEQRQQKQLDATVRKVESPTKHKQDPGKPQRRMGRITALSKWHRW